MLHGRRFELPVDSELATPIEVVTNEVFMVNQSTRLNHAIAVLGVSLAAISPSQPVSAASLDAFAGVLGGSGIGTVPGGCSNAPPPALSFFSFTGTAWPVEGIAACGYSGSLDQVSAVTGPLGLSKSLAPVSLGSSPGSGSFDGSAQSVANFGRLGATAHAFIGTGRPSGNTQFQSIAAARFSDTLTASSPLVAAASAGFVSYQFSVDGSLTALGAPEAFYFGETYMALDLQHQSGPTYQVVNATVRRGGIGTLSNRPPPTGWTTGEGSLIGGSTLFARDFPMVWGQAWDVKVGLVAWAYGTSDSNFLSTARLTGMTLYDANHNLVSAFNLSAASGTDYVSAVPEPQTWLLWLLGLAWVGCAYSLTRGGGRGPNARHCVRERTYRFGRIMQGHATCDS